MQIKLVVGSFLSVILLTHCGPDKIERGDQGGPTNPDERRDGSDRPGSETTNHEDNNLSSPEDACGYDYPVMKDSVAISKTILDLGKTWVQHNGQGRVQFMSLPDVKDQLFAPAVKIDFERREMTKLLYVYDKTSIDSDPFSLMPKPSSVKWGDKITFNDMGFSQPYTGEGFYKNFIIMDFKEASYPLLSGKKGCVYHAVRMDKVQIQPNTLNPEVKETIDTLRLSNTSFRSVQILGGESPKKDPWDVYFKSSPGAQYYREIPESWKNL